MISKIEDHHRNKAACIYIRQSTVAQVRHHQESTERQYRLKEKALELGWAPSMIRILDQDLGQSGAQIAGREGFKTLVADVSMGHVGAVFALEASRLARSSLQWHRLIELCSLTSTLVIDEDGCYDPAEFNDALLLGLKGQIAQAELHFIRVRLQGGKRNKAQKGELRFPLPVGLCYDDEGRTVLDPDLEVQGAVRQVFRIFRQTGTAYAVVHQFAKQGLRFPKRAYGGAWDGKLLWGRLSHARCLGVLKNPSYAGAYVHGRYQSIKEVTADGEVRLRTVETPIEKWHVLIKNHHEGYIGWEEYRQNCQRLQGNRTNREEMLLKGSAREGLALLQGLLVCGKCGRKLYVRYKGNGGIYPCYQCVWKKREGLSTAHCMDIGAPQLDKAVVERVLNVVEPEQIKIAIQAVEELERRDEAVSTQWRMRVDRAEYETQLAERRYLEVDPSNRLVAGTLEQRWNMALEQLEEIRTQYKEFQRKHLQVATPEQKAKVLALAKNFRRVWNAPSTKTKDKKRMLRLLIKDVTIEKTEKKKVVLHLRWQGGACEDLFVDLLPSMADQVRYPEKVVGRVRELAGILTDADIAEILNQEGRTSPKGKAFTASMIKWVRYRYEIPSPSLKRPEELTVQEMTKRFGVSMYVVYYWIQRGIVQARRINNGSPYWISMDDKKEKELSEWVRDSRKLQNLKNNV
jgi:DNA invertase Pin-like site-specific DNA recombinase